MTVASLSLTLTQGIWGCVRRQFENRRVQRLGSSHRIEVLAKKRDLPGVGAQEDDVGLLVGASRQFDDPLGLDFGDCATGIGKRLDCQIDESEMRDGLYEPSAVTHNSVAARQPGRMPERRRKRQLPDHSWRKKALPGHGLVNERIEMLPQQFSPNGHGRPLTRVDPSTRLETSCGAKYIWYCAPIRATRCIASGTGSEAKDVAFSTAATASKNAWCNGVEMPRSRHGSAVLLENPCREFGGRMTTSPVSHRIQSSAPSMTRKNSTVPERT